MNINEQSSNWKLSPAKGARVGYKVSPVIQHTWSVSNRAKSIPLASQGVPVHLDCKVLLSSIGNRVAFSLQNYELSNSLALMC